jgi:hypothetical protein
MTDELLHDPPPPEPWRDNTSPGRVQRPGPILEDGPVPPFQGRVSVTPLRLNGYANVQYDVVASWVGPKLPGTRDAKPGQLVSASDSYLEENLELARAIAIRALEQLRAGAIPDLRALAQNLRTRTK